MIDHYFITMLMDLLLVQVIDNIPNNEGGLVDITNGGLGKTFVEFLFTSQWSKRMSFSIEIYGSTSTQNYEVLYK